MGFTTVAFPTNKTAILTFCHVAPLSVKFSVKESSQNFTPIRAGVWWETSKTDNFTQV